MNTTIIWVNKCIFPLLIQEHPRSGTALSTEQIKPERKSETKIAREFSVLFFTTAQIWVQQISSEKLVVCYLLSSRQQKNTANTLLV